MWTVKVTLNTPVRYWGGGYQEIKPGGVVQKLGGINPPGGVDKSLTVSAKHGARYKSKLASRAFRGSGGVAHHLY